MVDSPGAIGCRLHVQLTNGSLSVLTSIRIGLATAFCGGWGLDGWMDGWMDG